MGADRRPAAQLARWRRFALLLAVPLVLVTSGAVAAAPGPRPAREAVLTGTTRVTWTGTKGFVLRVPRDVKVPWYGARLHLRSGTYASVRRSSPSCRDADPSCAWGALDRLPGMDSDIAGPGTAHWPRFGDDDDILRARTYYLYLFTDGEATLEYDNTGLPGGVREYRATGRISGVAERLPVTCPTTVGCTTTDGYGRKLVVGGRARDVGRAGSADVIVGSHQKQQIAPGQEYYPHTSMIRGCTYPDSPTDPTPADPARHPRGCDTSDDDLNGTSSEAVMTAVWVGTGVAAWTGHWVDSFNFDATGLTYLGFQVAVPVDLGDVSIDAYAVWFTYGVR